MKKNVSFLYSIIFGLLIVSLSACVNAQSSNDLKDAVGNGAFIVDVRTPAEYAAGTAPGAVNIPLHEVQARLSEFEGKGEIVVFCKSGNRSGQAKNILEKNGHKEVINGGTWQNVKAAIESSNSSEK